MASAPVIVEATTSDGETQPVVKLEELKNLLKQPSASVLEPQNSQRDAGKAANSHRHAEKDEQIKELSNMVKQLVAEQQDMK